MIKVYVKDGCVFCAMVLAKIDELGIEAEEKNVSDPENVKDMITIGGKRQEPFIVDDECGVHMYESMEIVEYLNKKYQRAQEEDGTDGESPKGVCP